MRKKSFVIDGTLDSISNKEDLEETGVIFASDGKTIKVFYPMNQEEPKVLFDNKEKPKAFVKSGDKGCGLPGSIEWHATEINQIEPDEIREYVKEITGKEISVEGRIDYTRKRAIRIIKEYLDGND